jgi:hypothetical protein
MNTISVSIKGLWGNHLNNDVISILVQSIKFKLQKEENNPEKIIILTNKYVMA